MLAAAAARNGNLLPRSSLRSKTSGIPTNAIRTDVKRAYRQLAQLYHPDVNSSDAAKTKFKAVNLAYEVLSDQELKRQYDQYGLDVMGNKYAFLRDFLDMASGKAGMLHVGETGSNLYTVLGLTFEEAMRGCEKSVEVAALGQCPDCQGSGLRPDAVPESCEICHGAGEILRTRANGKVGRSTLLGVCPACGGKGLQCVAYCPRCAGEGRARVERSINVRIPAGAEGGSVVRLKGLGDAGRFGGGAGHLFISVRVESVGDMQLVGHDLHSTVAISVYDAVLGTRLSVPTVRGSRLLQVPPGTQHGEELVIEGAGIAYSQAGVMAFGNAVFKVLLQLHDTSQEQRALLQRLQQAQLMVATSAAQAAGRPDFSDVFDLTSNGAPEAA